MCQHQRSDIMTRKDALIHYNTTRAYKHNCKHNTPASVLVLTMQAKKEVGIKSANSELAILLCKKG